MKNHCWESAAELIRYSDILDFHVPAEAVVAAVVAAVVELPVVCFGLQWPHLVHSGHFHSHFEHHLQIAVKQQEIPVEELLHLGEHQGLPH